MQFAEHDVACLKGFNLSAGSLPSVKDAMHVILCISYGDSTAELQTWEKLHRNAEFYRGYLAGEDSMVLARAYGLSDRRMRTIIDYERNCRGQLGNTSQL
jgi:hypothetical protein